MAHLAAPFLGKRAIDMACEGAKKAVERAKAGDKEDVRTMEYMEAARLAIWGLGQEREEILSEALHCDLKEEKHADNLADRIDKYLRTNRLRPELERAIEGLRECHLLIQQRSEKILHWPLWGRGDRAAVLDEVASLLAELINFLDGLGNRMQYLNPSGIGAVELLHVESALHGRTLDREQARLQLGKAVEDARTHSSNREWLDITLKAESIGIWLRSAFR